MAPSKIGEWLDGKIAECVPGGVRGRSGVGDLLAALAFFDGKRSQVFGMSSDPSKIPEASTLRSACEKALHHWFDELSRSDPAGQVELFEVAERMQLGLGFAEPAVVSRRRMLAAERDRLLGQLGRPSDALAAWPALQRSLADLRTVQSVPLKAVQKYLKLPHGFRLSGQEWMEDSWGAVASKGLEPELLPLADGGDGNYLGVYVDGGLLQADGDAPLVYYFHEEDPPLTFLFENGTVAAMALRAAAAKAPKKDVTAGKETDAVRRVIEARMPAPTRPLGRSAEEYEKEGNPFAALHIRAQRIWQEFDQKLKRLGT